MTRPNNNQQKKKKKKKGGGTCKIVDFAVPADHRVKLKVSEKNDKYLDLARKLKKLEHKSDNYTNCNWCSWYSRRRINKGTGELGNKRTSGDYLNYYIIENCQNTEKKSWRLYETCCHSNFSERPSANADVKNSQKVNK